MKYIKIVFSILFFIFFFYLLGPKPDFNPIIPVIENLPSDLDSYLKKNESKFEPLVDNTRKKIFWYHKDKRKTKFSIVYFHGYTASRHDLHPVIKNVAKKLKANLFMTRLYGHGTKDPDGLLLGSVKANNWLYDSEEGYKIAKAIGNNVIAIGISTGATLIHTIASRKKDLHSMVFISPNFHPKNPGTALLTKPWSEYLVKVFEGDFRQWKPKNEFQKTYWTWRYPSEGLIQMMHLVEYSLSLDPRKVTTPLMLIYTKKDKVVSVPLMFERFNLYASKPKVMKELKEATRHTIAGQLSPEVNLTLEKEILNFLIPLTNEDQ